MPTMEVKYNFKFRVNVSNDYYVKKTDASACLSKDGAKSIGKVKMAFREQDVTVDEFLQYALNGYAFCNLFHFDTNQSYWFETGNGQRYQTTPLYKNGKNKGCMRIEFKSDRFFIGAQTVFVDIDLTRFELIPEYLACLTYKPTCVYMSYSDKLEKDKVTSRRFRMVYVFDRIMGKDDLNVISQTITDSIIRDTGESMKDDCGTRVSQYFNGVYGNEECYVSDCIYSRLDFPDSLPEVEVVMPEKPTKEKKPEVEFDSQLLHDMGTMDYETFMHYYSWKYRYIYKTQKDEWIDGLYQLTDDSYIQLWWVRERIKDGHHRRRTLSKFACLRRLMEPDITPDTLLFDMYVDCHRFIDNSDGIITMETMKRRVKSVMRMSQEDLREYCDYEIGYWKEHRPKFIYHPSANKTQWLTGKITTAIRYSEIDGKYDRSKSVKENAEALGIPVRSLYRYCHERRIDTKPGKGKTLAEQREVNRKAKVDKKARFMMLYNPSLSAGENRKNMLREGLKLSKNTIIKWSKDYISPDLFTFQPKPLSQGNIDNDFNLEITPLKPEPHYDTSNDFNWQAPRVHVSESLSRFGQEEREYDPNYAELEKIWNKLCD